jgi:hypothetical protein
MTKFTRISKQVGWDKLQIETYPTIESVQQAYDQGDLTQVLTWYRFLRSPADLHEQMILTELAQAFTKLRDAFTGVEVQ